MATRLPKSPVAAAPAPPAAATPTPLAATAPTPPAAGTLLPPITPPILLKAGCFHQLTKGAATIINEANSLDILIKANPLGMAEKPLLEWFGESAARIALFALGLPNQSYVPTHVAREITYKNFRADFACLYVDTLMRMPPRLLLIEAQGALHNSVFETKGRTTPQWSKDFLSGFSQVVDWHCFQGDVAKWPPLTKLVAKQQPTQVDFAVIAGLEEDVADDLSQGRLAHWIAHVGFGNNLHISTFDALSIRTTALFNRMAFIAGLP